MALATDPSTNHNIACNAHHTERATWFFERNDVQGVEVNRLRVATLDSWERVPLSHSAPDVPNNIPYLQLAPARAYFGS